MNLPYVRQVDYLSPSSLVSFEVEPVRFYLERCGPIEARPPREPQGFPAAVGVAFDALVKRAVAEATGVECPPLEALLAGVEAEPERARALGADLLRAYLECGALAAFVLQGPTRLDVRLTQHVPDSVDPVPILGIVDAAVAGGVHDWKVTGANRPGEVSPTSGYVEFLGFDGTRKGPHARHGEPLEALNAKWASQLATYGWLLRFSGPIAASVDEVVVGRGVARFRATISEDFQEALRGRYRAAWAAIQEERVVEPRLATCGLSFVRALKEVRRWG